MVGKDLPYYSDTLFTRALLFSTLRLRISVKRKFVWLPTFERKRISLGLDDAWQRALEAELLDDPKRGDLIQGTHGLRKLRFTRPGMGKSGGVRVFYYDYESYELLYLIALLAKGEKDNLSKAERNVLGAMVLGIRREYL